MDGSVWDTNRPRRERVSNTEEGADAKAVAGRDAETVAFDGAEGASQIGFPDPVAPVTSTGLALIHRPDASCGDEETVDSS